MLDPVTENIIRHTFRGYFDFLFNKLQLFTNTSPDLYFGILNAKSILKLFLCLNSNVIISDITNLWINSQFLVLVF